METEFREMRRFKQQMTEEECKELLFSEERGTLAVNGDDGYPYAFPMNFTYDADSNSLILHSAKSGYKLDCIRRSDKACFCLHNTPTSPTGALPRDVKSIVIFGRISIVDDPAEIIGILERFDNKFEDPETVKAHLKREGHLAVALILRIEHMTGKKVVEG